MKKSLDQQLLENLASNLTDLWEDWNKVNHHDKTPGLSQKAVNAYRREHPGSKLQTAVTTKPSKLKPGSKAAKRRKSFCARMSGNKGPMKKPNGKPTPKALALRRWNCESIEQMAQMIVEGAKMIAEIKKGAKDSNGFTKCWPGKHAEGTKKGRNGGQVRNCVPNEGVAEGSLEELANTSLDVKEPKDMYNVNDRKQTTYKLFKFKSGKNTFLINFTVKSPPTYGKKQNWNAVIVSFGVKEKQDDYSFGDEMNTDLTGKNKNQFLIYSTVINTIRRFITEYNTEIDEIIMQGAGERQEAMYQRFFQSAGKYFPGWHYDGKHSLVRDVPRQKVKKVREQGVAEGSLEEFAIDKEPNGDNRSKLIGTIVQLLKSGKKVDFYVPGIRGHVVGSGGNGDWLTLKRWNKPYSKINYSLELDASDDSRFSLKMIKPDYYQVVQSEDMNQGVAEGENWSKHNNKRAGGMSKKSVSVYRREHPGSKIKTAVTKKPSKIKKGSKDASRRKSFCARMKGMKKHRTGAKTAHDPNSNINKSLRRWHCESIEEMQQMIENAQNFISETKKKAVPSKERSPGAFATNKHIASQEKKHSDWDRAQEEFYKKYPEYKPK